MGRRLDRFEPPARAPVSNSAKRRKDAPLHEKDLRPLRCGQDGDRGRPAPDHGDCLPHEVPRRYRGVMPGAGDRLAAIIDPAQMERPSPVRTGVGHEERAAVAEGEQEITLLPRNDEVELRRIELYDKHFLWSSIE